MKKVILLLLIVFGFTSCKKDEIISPYSRQIAIIDTAEISIDTISYYPTSLPEDLCECYYIVGLWQITHNSTPIGYFGDFVDCNLDTISFDMSISSYYNFVNGHSYCGPI